MDINVIIDRLVDEYKKAHDKGDEKACVKMIEVFKTIGVIPKEDKLDTINRMAGKKKHAVM